MTSQTLASHDDYLITLHPFAEGRGGSLVFTFGAQPSHRTEQGFGTSYCKLNGWDHIFVAQRAGTQYQGLSLEAFVDAVASCGAGRDLVCYGSSLGAYCALYYGGAIDSRIIAAAPRFPAWPRRADPKYADLAVTHHELWEVPRSSKAPVLIYDRYLKGDVATIEEMAARAYPDARHVQTDYAGHGVLVEMSRAKVLSRFIRTLVERDEIIDFDLPTDSAGYMFTKAKTIMRTNPAEARALMEQSLEKHPSKHVFLNLISMMLRTGEIDDARALVERGRSDPTGKLQLTPQFERMCREQGIIP